MTIPLVDRPEHLRVAFTQLWDKSILGLCLVSQEGEFLSANPAFCILTEYTEVELQSKKLKDITHPEDVDAALKMSAQVFDQSREQYTMRKRYITKTGRIVWIVLRVVPIVVNGKFEFFISQVSELLEIMPPVNGGNYPKIRTPKASSLAFRWFKDNFAWITVVLSAIGIIIANIIKKMEG